MNQVGDPALDSTQRKQLERQAMTLAVQDARLNAETLAQAAGVRLGPVRSMSASGAPPVMPMYRAKMVMSDAAAAPPPPEGSYDAGRDEVRCERQRAVRPDRHEVTIVRLVNCQDLTY